MVKKKIETRMVSYGIYSPFDKKEKQLPKILEFTTKIPARLGVEFGYILEIKKARGRWISFEIEHPPFTDDDGNISPTFTGEEFINANEYRFFLGDTFWPPLEDKTGDWILRTYLDGELLAEKKFTAVPDTQHQQEENEQWPL